MALNSTFHRNLIPESDNSYDLGSSSKKWRNGYFNSLNLKVNGEKR